jgi:hypothetical protein
MSSSKTAIIRIEKAGKQNVGDITKITGLVKAKYLIPIIDTLDLEANPRSSKTGSVTNSIQESIATDPQTFPFKTKGILLAASIYEELDRGRLSISFEDTAIEGILDGGHNLLAIGLFMLKQAYDYAEETMPKGAFTWSEFKELWAKSKLVIKSFTEYLRTLPDDDPNHDMLRFYVPIELLVPTDQDDFNGVEYFKANLLDICSARNNNVQLRVEAKANQMGYFDDLKTKIERKNPSLHDRIEWKTNDGGDVKIADIIALGWIPLTLIPSVKDSTGKVVDPPAPNKLYSGKGDCVARFERFMSSGEVTKQVGDYKKEIINPMVVSALKITAELPELYDYIYAVFPELYNKADGKYGRIGAVKALNEKRKKKTTPFENKIIPTMSPEGFITPLIYGMIELLERDNEADCIKWRVDDPKQFLVEKLPEIVKRYSNVLAPWGYDPQKVGKAPQSYEQASDAYKMALAGII